MHSGFSAGSCVLVTGASGFIGEPLLEELGKHGVEVHAVGRDFSPKRQTATVVWHQIDLLETDPVALLASVNPSHCIHLAWEATPGHYRTARENYDWVAATVRLARAFYDRGGQSFTMAGSCAEYAQPTPICDEKTAALAEDCAYAVCKADTARILASLARDAETLFACGRIFYIYGPGEPQGKLVGSICRALARGKAIPLTSGDDVVDYIFLSDVVRAFVRLASSSISGPVNIGTGRPTIVRDIATRLGEISGRSDLLQFGKVPLGREPVTVVAANKRLTREVGYSPEISLEQGLRACYDYWNSICGAT
jgi:nucleoside-diphosphate-sugar epimerase